MEVLERLERSIAYTLENVATEPETDGDIIGLSSLNPNVKPIQDSLFVNEKRKENEAGDNIANPPQSSVPAWALAAGTQLNLTGIKAKEAKPLAKLRPISRSETPQETLPGLPEKPISAALSSAERDLHRHSHTGISTSPLEEEKLRARGEFSWHHGTISQENSLSLFQR